MSQNEPAHPNLPSGQVSKYLQDIIHKVKKNIPELLEDA
jgi:hypothetical protein